MTVNVSTYVLRDSAGAIIPLQVYDANTGECTPVDASHPIPIAYSTATLTSRSGTITLGGTAQSFMAANTSRKGWFLENLSSGDLWVNRFGGTASADQPSLRIPPGFVYETPAGGSGGNALSIYGATTGQAFTAGEW